MARELRTDFLTGSTGDRRTFLRETVGRAIEQAVALAERRVVARRYVRPPGALPEMAFLGACTRCGECGAACPVGAIVTESSHAGLAAGTPVIRAATEACIACPDMPCAAACPTEALSVPELGWVGLRLGALELDPERCIAFHGSECGVCARECPIGEAALSLDDEGRPVLKAEGCVGCGVCVRACVTAPSSLSLHPLER